LVRSFPFTSGDGVATGAGFDALAAVPTGAAADVDADLCHDVLAVAPPQAGYGRLARAVLNMRSWLIAVLR
jgi:hypothetical protein